MEEISDALWGEAAAHRRRARSCRGLCCDCAGRSARMPSSAEAGGYRLRGDRCRAWTQGRCSNERLAQARETLTGGHPPSHRTQRSRMRWHCGGEARFLSSSWTGRRQWRRPRPTGRSPRSRPRTSAWRRSIAAGRAVEVAEEAVRLAEVAPSVSLTLGTSLTHCLHSRRPTGRCPLPASAGCAAGFADELRESTRARRSSSWNWRCLRQDPGLDVYAAIDPAAECPWPGLLAYQAKDTGFFFGRDDEIATCLTRLDEAGALVVAGALRQRQVLGFVQAPGWRLRLGGCSGGSSYPAQTR